MTKYINIHICFIQSISVFPSYGFYYERMEKSPCKGDDAVPQFKSIEEV